MTLPHMLLSVLFEAHRYDATVHLPYAQWLKVQDYMSVVGLYLDELEGIDDRGPVSYHNPK